MNFRQPPGTSFVRTASAADQPTARMTRASGRVLSASQQTTSATCIVMHSSCPTSRTAAKDMLPKDQLVAILLSITCFTPSICGETRDVSHGEKGKCIVRINSPGNERLGAPSWSCTQGFTRVFTGTVESATDVSDTEKRLELIPDEVFLGDASELTATVNPACFPDNEPEIQTGDRWLFYVRPRWHWDKETLLPKSDGFEVAWDSPSKPVSEAEDDIETLRHLAALTDTGILIGRVVRIGPTFDALNPTAVPNHKLIAKSVQSGTEYAAFTNMNGRFELELPPGSYDVTASTEQGLRDADPFNAYISARGCTEMAVRLLVDGKLAGRVTKGDGRPASSQRSQ